MMKFSWDEAKRLATLAARALDFRDANLFFDGRPVLHASSPRAGEARLKSTAKIEGRYFTLVWLGRDDFIHVISMRRAHDKEIRAFHDLYG